MKKIIISGTLMLPWLCFSQFVVHIPFRGEPVFCKDPACKRKAKLKKQLRQTRKKAKKVTFNTTITLHRHTKPVDTLPRLEEPAIKDTSTPSTPPLQSMTCYFGTDQTEIDSIFHQQLDTLLSLFLQHKVSAISVIGHTDSVGTLAYNLDLSRRRAHNIKEALLSKGIPSQMIYIQYKAFMNPPKPVDGSNARRVELFWQ